MALFSKPAPEPGPAREKSGWLTRLRGGLARSAGALSEGLQQLATHRKLDDAMLDELRDTLLRADLGVDVTQSILSQLKKDRFDTAITLQEVRAALAAQLEAPLAPLAKPFALNPARAPHVVLMIGVNGTGKTTTIGKIAAQLQRSGSSVMLAAGDTFRAAAVEQLQIWGQRLDVPVITAKAGGDPAALAFQALERAQAENAAALFIDTAGRLHNRAELMAELEKIIRVIKKRDPSAPHSVLLTLDATTGQNALDQVEIFARSCGVTGLVMTKLDGTAKGGILVALAAKHALPVHFIGVGEGVDDLQPFNAHDFAQALVGLQT